MQIAKCKLAIVRWCSGSRSRVETSLAAPKTLSAQAHGGRVEQIGKLALCRESTPFAERKATMVGRSDYLPKQFLDDIRLGLGQTSAPGVSWTCIAKLSRHALFDKGAVFAVL